MDTRLIIYTDSRKKADVNTFKAAALTLKKTYQNRYIHAPEKIVLKFVKSGKEIARAINGIGRGKLISLDIVSHGNQGGIHISRDLIKPEKSDLLKRNAHVIIRRSTDRPQSDADAEYMEESMHGLYSDYASKVGVSYYYNQKLSGSVDIATLDDIDFAVFSEDAVVEFHGCRTAEVIPLLNLYLKDNFAKNFSDSLNEKATVIGHITNTAPNKNPNGNSNDYRYGKVRVYRGGKMIKDSVERSRLKIAGSSTPGSN